MDDLAQYSPRRRARRGGDDRLLVWKSPLRFRLVPAVSLPEPRRNPHAWRPRLG